KMAVDKGFSNGMLALGNLYMFQGSEDRGKEWYVKSAEAGNTQAMILVADLCYRQDKKTAEHYYKMASDAGNVRATCLLAKMYGKQKKYDLAKQCCHKAVDAGNRDAMNELGNLHK